MRKKVVVDCRLWGLKHAGIGRYTQNIVEGIEKIVNPSDMEIVPLRFPVKHYTVKEQIIIPRLLHASRPDLVHFPHFNVPLFWSGSFVVTIHDLLWHEQIGFNATTLPRGLYLAKYLAYRLVMNHAVNQSKAIIVPSKWVRSKLIGRYPWVQDKIRVIPEGVAVDTWRQPDSAEQIQTTLKKYDLKPRNYIVYTGSLYPHKNAAELLDAVEQLAGLKLVVACARSIFWKRFRSEVDERQLAENVILAGFVPDNELRILYRQALAFVFPSLSEGFGLPGLEAMAASCPVLSSTAGSLPEVYQQAAWYFDPTDASQLVALIRKLADNSTYRLELIAAGRKRASQFSWVEAARATLSIYHQILFP